MYYFLFLIDRCLRLSNGDVFFWPKKLRKLNRHFFSFDSVYVLTRSVGFYFIYSFSYGFGIFKSSNVMVPILICVSLKKESLRLFIFFSLMIFDSNISIFDSSLISRELKISTHGQDEYEQFLWWFTIKLSSKLLNGSCCLWDILATR